MSSKNIVSDFVRKIQEIRQIMSNIFEHSNDSSGSSSDSSSDSGSDCGHEHDISSEPSNDDSSDTEYDTDSPEDSSDTENEIVKMSQEDIEPNTFRCLYKVKEVNLAKRCKSEIENCTICLSQFANREDVRRLRCFHLFHTKCIDEWFKNKELCPNCRAHICSVSC